MKFRYSLSCVDGKTNVLTVTSVLLISRKNTSILPPSLLPHILNPLACVYAHIYSSSFYLHYPLFFFSARPCPHLLHFWFLAIYSSTNKLFYILVCHDFFRGVHHCLGAMLLFFMKIKASSALLLPLGGIWMDQWGGTAASKPVWGNSHLRNYSPDSIINSFQSCILLCNITPL